MSHNGKKLAVDRMLEDSREILAVPAVIDRLGHYATRLEDVVERSSYAGVDEQGFLVINERGPSEVPVAAQHVGERATLHGNDSRLSKAQIDTLVRRYGPAQARMFDRGTSDFFLHGNHGPLPVFEHQNDYGLTASNVALRDSKTHVSGRPYVAMNMDARVNGRLSPIIYIHEAAHVLQREDLPIQSPDYLLHNKMERELEAYYVAAQIIRGYMDLGKHEGLRAHTPKREMIRALKIDDTRSKHQLSENPFYPHKTVLNALFDNGLTLASGHGEMVDSQGEAN